MTLALCGSLGAMRALAAPPEPLYTDFLDYLAQCEGKDDNWTVVASDKERKKAAAPPTKTAAPPEAANEEAKP